MLSNYNIITILKAYKKGETIEYSDNNVNWKEIPKDDMLFHFDFKNKYYRIKKN